MNNSLQFVIRQFVPISIGRKFMRSLHVRYFESLPISDTTETRQIKHALYFKLLQKERIQ